MKVTIKSFDVEMEVKNAGIEFEVYSPDRRENGKEIGWTEFIEWAETQEK